MEHQIIDKIYGTPTPNREWLGAIVIQGPYYKNHTEISVREFLVRNPLNVLVILATYIREEELSEFEKDQLKTASAPYYGRFICISCKRPSPNHYPAFWKTNWKNQNLQRLTSFAGLKYAADLGIKAALKIRSDSFLAVENCVYFFLTQINKYPLLLQDDGKLYSQKERMVVSDMCGKKSGKYFIVDLWMFGFVEDLMTYFDVRDSSWWHKGTRMPTESRAPESNLGQCWKNEMQISDRLSIQEILFRYFIVVDRDEILFFWPRWHDYSRLVKEGAREYLTSLPRRFEPGNVSYKAWLEGQVS